MAYEKPKVFNPALEMLDLLAKGFCSFRARAYLTLGDMTVM